MNTNLSFGDNGIVLTAVAAAVVLVWLQVTSPDQIRDLRALRRTWIFLVSAVVSTWVVGFGLGVLMTGIGPVPGSPLLVVGWVLGLVPGVFWVGYLLGLYRAVAGRSLFDRQPR